MNDKKELLVLPAVKNIDEIVKGISTPIKLTKGKYCNLEFRFKNGEVSVKHSNIDIKDFSNVWLSSFWKSRDLAYAAKLYLDYYNVAHTYVEKVTSKITDQMIFALNNISTPNTFFVEGHDITNHIDTIEDICGYPLIIKDVRGSRGKNSVYVQNRTDLVRLSAELPAYKKFLYQRYIPNNYDWGILIANGKIVSAEKSYPKAGEFRNNCNGATELFIEINQVPLEIKKMALIASEKLGLSWSRSDIIVDRDTSKPYLMEINRSPGVTSGTMEVVGARGFLTEHLQLSS